MMKLYLFQVIVISPTFHYSKFIAAENKKEAMYITECSLKNNEEIELVRKVEKAIGRNKEYKVVLEAF